MKYKMGEKDEKCLSEPRYFLGSGNVVLDGGKLLVHGGSNEFLNPYGNDYYRYLMSKYDHNIHPEKWYPEKGYASTELISANSDASITSAFSNQTKVYQHCNIQINSTNGDWNLHTFLQKREKRALCVDTMD